MSISIHGLAVSKGVAIGRAVVITSSRADVAHYFIEQAQVGSEIQRFVHARNDVVEELERLQQGIAAGQHKDTSDELTALLDVHIMLLQDQSVEEGVRHWITDRHYNAEWALASQLEVLAREFDAMEDAYLRERKADLEQVVERVIARMRGIVPGLMPPPAAKAGATDFSQSQLFSDSDLEDLPVVLIAHDLSPADMLQFKKSVFAGFATDVGGTTSHTAIVARSLDIAALVGARTASQLVRQDDIVIIDGDAGVLIVDPSPMVLREYAFKQRQVELERERLSRLKHTSATTMDGISIELLANIAQPEDVKAALEAGAQGVGLFRTEFLFMGKAHALPDEEQQYAAYKMAVDAARGKAMTIRSIDVGSDKPLEGVHDKASAHLNPALGLRAIRYSLSEPAMFLTQLRAILRAAAHGPVHLMFPMLAHASEIRQTLNLVERAKQQLKARGQTAGVVKLGAMIEIPAAAIAVDMFCEHFDFLSIGTNDLIQYTLAIDRADETVAHLYDPLHPAVLQLIARTIERAHAHGVGVSVCGEMAGDARFTKLLLGLGLRSFSMHPAQLLAVKQEVLRADAGKLQAWAQGVVQSSAPAQAIKCAP
jgi:phosphoenolpyruvate-protein phosphotransferase (PTS system enzyme I)